MRKPGFAFIEVISPCPTVYGRMNKEPEGLDSLRNYIKRSIIKNGADTRDTAIDKDGPIIVGKFLDIQQPTIHDYLSLMKDKAQKQVKK